MSLTENPVLLLILSAKPGLLLAKGCPRTFVHNGENFQDTDDQDFNGFYDFLRDDSRHVLGISFSPPALHGFLMDCVRSLPYVEVPCSTTLRIFFREERNFNPSISMDQYFGDNRIYRSPGARVALSFGLTPLGLAEISSISAIAVPAPPGA